MGPGGGGGQALTLVVSHLPGRSCVMNTFLRCYFVSWEDVKPTTQDHIHALWLKSEIAKYVTRQGSFHWHK